MARLDINLERNTNWRSTIATCRYVHRTNESFSGPIARRMALMIIKKFDSAGRIWHAVQAPLNGRATAAAHADQMRRPYSRAPAGVERASIPIAHF